MTTNEKVACGVAASGVACQQWLPTMHDVSVTAAELAPILGSTYLSLQILYWIYKRLAR